MSALDQVLTISIVKLEHPSLHKQAAAELAALRSERDALKVAAKKLLNEMPEGEIELIREVWGNTNTRILLERRSELAAALAGNE